MHNVGVNGGGDGAGAGSITAEDLISKLKDDGDYDRLRVKIIRKLKENEELRGSIISLVKESTALNSPGAENMKPRQLSDAIHLEIGDKLMSQISDSLWNVIRSADGMKTEIKDTVQSVYDKISNPHGDDNSHSSSRMDSYPIQIELENIQDSTTSAREIDVTLSDGEPNEPPGFGLSDLQHNYKNDCTDQQNEICAPSSSRKRKAVDEITKEKLQSEDFSETDNIDFGAPPGFCSVLEHKQLGNASDEDPDVPPGFG